MPGFTPYQFTTQQLVDIRRFCGFPTLGNGTPVFAAPWIQTIWLALEYRMQNISPEEASVVINTYLTPLYALESAIPTAAANLNIGTAAVYTRNPKEMRERRQALDDWRRRLCGYLGILPGPDLTGQSDGGSIRMVV